MKRILMLHGPNLNLLGVREPDVYGTTTLPELEAKVAEWGGRMGVDVTSFQSNHEGELIDRIHAARTDVDGLVVNFGALSHTSYALHDAIVAVDLPAVEVHISNIMEREPWRRRSVTGPACAYTVYGRGVIGYRDGLRILLTRSASPVTELRYGEHPDQVIDVRGLPDTGARPVAVFFHGGFWRSEYTRDTIDGLAADLAGRGWVTANVEYRRSGWPAVAADVAAALDRIADVRGVDASDVVMIGHSAGAHLALWSAGRHTVRPHTIVGLAAVTDLVQAFDLDMDSGAAARLMGGSPADEPAAYGRAAVTVQPDIRYVLVHGGRDALVPAESSRVFAERNADVAEITLVEAAEFGHFELLDPARELWQNVAASLRP